MNSLCRIFGGCLFAAIVSSATPVSENGQLSVSGAKILNASGNEISLRGMSLFWNIWYGNFFNANVVNTLASTGSTGWNANLLRAPISDRDVSLAKNMIDYANNAGIYIIIDNHSHCAHKNTDAVKSFFADVSAYVKQKGYKNVLYELYNEPVYENCTSETDPGSGGSFTSWETIKTFAEQVIPAIRANDANGIIIVGTPNYSKGTEYARANPITGYSNIMYSLHFYASTQGHLSLRYSLLRAKCNNFPVFISEWGTSEYTGDGNVNTEYNHIWLSWLETLKASWANWSIVDKGESSGALISGAGSGGYWSDAQLSTSGNFVRPLLRGLNAGGSLTSVGLEDVSADASCSYFDGNSTSEFVRDGIGIFSYNIQAENYMDSSNSVTVIDSSMQNDRYMTPSTLSNEASLDFTVTDIPAKGTYMLYVRAGAPDNDVVMHITIDGTSYSDSVVISKTGALKTLATAVSTIKLPVVGTSDVKFLWTGNLSFDYFVIAIADSSDSANYNIKKEEISGLNDHVTDNAQIATFDLSSKVFSMPGGAVDRIDIYSLSGEKVYTMIVSGRSSVSLGNVLPNGLYVAVFTGRLGRVWPQRITVFN